MQRISVLALAPILLAFSLHGCAKEASKPTAEPAPKAAKSTPAPAETPAPSEPAPKAEAEVPKASIATKTEVAKADTPTEGVADEEKAKLAKVYTEIYCAQRRGESEKLLDIYTKNGFNDPETWTKVWTKAAQDGAWVAQTTHDAIRACGDQAPPTAAP